MSEWQAEWRSGEGLGQAGTFGDFYRYVWICHCSAFFGPAVANADCVRIQNRTGFAKARANSQPIVPPLPPSASALSWPSPLTQKHTGYL